MKNLLDMQYSFAFNTDNNNVNVGAIPLVWYKPELGTY